MSAEILILLFAILLNGFFAASELAIFSARRPRLRQRADNGDKGAKAALALVEDSGRLLSSVQIGITLIGVFAGAYGGAKLSEPLAAYFMVFPLIAPYADEIAFTLVIALITYISLILGELLPKQIVLAEAEKFACLVARPLLYFMVIARPFAWLLEISSTTLLNVLRLGNKRRDGVTEEEIKTMIEEGTETGVFEPAERDMIASVLRLGDRTVRAIMTPRPDIIWLDMNEDTETLAGQIITSGHSRLPLARGTLDEIIGVVQAKDLLNAALSAHDLDLLQLKRDVMTVHDGTPVLRLLELMRARGDQIAMVVDEYGTVEGMVTLTDILEAVTGEMPSSGEEAEMAIIEREDGSFLIDGLVPVDMLEGKIGLKNAMSDDDSYHTLAGFVLKQLARIPRAGDYFHYRGFRFEVMDMDARRIDKVLVHKPKEETETP